MKFVHAADLHLDSPLSGLERYEGAPVEEIRGATRGAVRKLVDMCLAEAVDLLLIAGDVYDGDWRDYNTGLFFAAQMARLSREGIRVFLVRGNHDAASQITKNLKLPEGIVELSTRKPQTVVLEDLGAVIHGRSYSTRDVTTDLSAAYPNATPGLFNIGLLHTALNGRAGHENYAPCTVGSLESKGYQYWALGHVHNREVVREDPWVVFPGNLQGRHARETGPKGASVVTVEDGRVVSVEHRDLDVVRWVSLMLDVSDASSGNEVVGLLSKALEAEIETAAGLTLAVRVHVSGTSKAHADLSGDPERWKNEFRLAAAHLTGDLWMEKILLRTRTVLDIEALLNRNDPVGEFLRFVRALRGDSQALGGLLAGFDDLRGKLPPEFRQLEDALDLENPASLETLLEDAEQLLIPRLLAQGEEQ